MRRALPCACGNPATIKDRCARCDSLEHRSSSGRNVLPDLNRVHWPQEVVPVSIKGWGYAHRSGMEQLKALNLAEIHAK